MSDDHDDNEFDMENDFRDEDEPDDQNDDVVGGDGDQEAQIDLISPDQAEKKKITER